MGAFTEMVPKWRIQFLMGGCWTPETRWRKLMEKTSLTKEIYCPICSKTHRIPIRVECDGHLFYLTINKTGRIGQLEPTR